MAKGDPEQNQQDSNVLFDHVFPVILLLNDYIHNAIISETNIFPSGWLNTGCVRMMTKDIKEIKILELESGNSKLAGEMEASLSISCFSFFLPACL